MGRSLRIHHSGPSCRIDDKEDRWELAPKGIVAPAASMVESSKLSPENGRAVVCLACGDTMKLMRQVPKSEELPGLLVFVCPSCGEREIRWLK